MKIFLNLICKVEQNLKKSRQQFKIWGFSEKKNEQISQAFTAKVTKLK